MNPKLHKRVRGNSLANILGRFVLRSLGIVTGALRELVFFHCALALAGNVKDLAEIDVRPHFRPFWLDTVLGLYRSCCRPEPARGGHSYRLRREMMFNVR